MTLLKRCAAILLAALLGLAGWSASAQRLQPPRVRPDAVMNAVTSEVTAILKLDRAAGRPTDVAQLVESKILPLFDLHRMTSTAVARNWSLASPEQQAALVTQFRMLVARTYSAALSGYRDQEIEYRPLRVAAGDTEVLVRSFVRRAGAEPLTIDYDMERSGAGWKVLDIKIAGSSLVMNYRETFAAVARNRDIDGLIKSMSDKNRQNAAGAKGADVAQLAPVLMIYFSGFRGQKE